jgi:hypothetical protein
VQIEIRSLRSLAVRRQRACVVGSVGQAKKKNWLKSITYQFRNSRTYRSAARTEGTVFTVGCLPLDRFRRWFLERPPVVIVSNWR